MKKSGIGKLNWKDLGKGAFLAGLVTLMTGIVQVLQAGPVEWTIAFWTPTFTATILTFLGYLIKNISTNSDDQLLTKEKS